MSNTPKQISIDYNSEYIDSAWDIKKQIMENQGYLKQNKEFFEETYKKGKCYIMKNTSLDKDYTNIGFCIVIDYNYIAMFGIRPKYQGQGYGKRLISIVKDNHNILRCHTRETNKKAIKFYENHGFNKIDSIENYYNDNENAVFYILRGSVS